MLRSDSLAFTSRIISAATDCGFLSSLVFSRVFHSQNKATPPTRWRNIWLSGSTRHVTLLRLPHGGHSAMWPSFLWSHAAEIHPWKLWTGAVLHIWLRKVLVAPLGPSAGACDPPLKVWRSVLGLKEHSQVSSDHLIMIQIPKCYTKSGNINSNYSLMKVRQSLLS